MAKYLTASKNPAASKAKPIETFKINKDRQSERKEEYNLDLSSSKLRRKVK